MSALVGVGLALQPATPSNVTAGLNAAEPASAAEAEAAERVAVHVKFVDDADVRVRGGVLVSRVGADMTAINQALTTSAVLAIRPLFSLPEADITASLVRAENRSGRELADLNSYFRLRLRATGDLAPLLEALTSSALVEAAYPAPEASPPPSFTGRQGYRDPAPRGVDAPVTASVPGGTGGNVEVIDIEYGWDESHEDLAKARGAFIENGTQRNLFGDDHGTAVLGQLVATPNDFGVTGLVPDAELGLVNVDTTDGYMLANAILIATSELVPGDVIVVEQQLCDHHATNCVPSESVRETYDAIVTATSAGIIVVEAAGNGGINLNQYGAQPFPHGRADSGAIIVGAGHAADCAASTGPARSRTESSTYGTRVNLQGWGNCVVTTGYGDLIDPGTGGRYTASFNGTSSATPIVAAAAASLSSAIQAKTGVAPKPSDIRRILTATGTPQDTTSAGALRGNIGPQPDLARAFQEAGLSGTTPPAGSNLLLNPGFELDANADSKPDSWTSNTYFTRSTAAVHGATYAGRWSSTANNGPASYQQVGVTAGMTYTFTGWVNAPTTADAFTFEIKVLWRTASGAISSTVIKRFTDDTAGAWQQVNGTAVAPAGATLARVQMVAGSLAATVYVDDFSFGSGAGGGPTTPDTTVISGPSGTVTATDASFAFSGSSGTTSFECRIDAAPFTACASPKAYSGLTVGQHTFEVRAVNDTAVDPTPASRTWTVSSTPPAGSNLLLNPGFELDANADSKPDSWTSNTYFTRSTAAVHGATYAGRWSSTVNNGPSSYQQVNVTAGTTYIFNGWVNAPTTADVFTFEVKILWRSASGAISATVIKKYTDDTSGAWQQVNGSAVAPAGATLARVQLKAGSLATTLYVDDFSFGP